MYHHSMASLQLLKQVSFYTIIQLPLYYSNYDNEVQLGRSCSTKLTDIRGNKTEEKQGINYKWSHYIDIIHIYVCILEHTC